MSYSKIKLLYFFLFFLLISFDKNEYFYIKIPAGFPELSIPEDNLLSEDKIKLGKKLFFEKLLSRDSSISCASCHQPKLAFSDGLKTAIGIKNRLTTRNTPSLTNIAYNKNFLRDGVNPSLEAQVIVPIHEKNEFDFHILLATERLKKNPKYVEQFEKVFGTLPSPNLISKAIASYERTLISGNSKFDMYHFQNKKNILSQSELNGKNLFFNKLYCTDCHNGFNFSNGQIVNNGLYENYNDVGKMRLTLNQEDNGCFKVPTLRNIEVTAPYMHDGSLETLSDVIDHYSDGGHRNINKHFSVKPFKISNTEKENLISFLKTLTDSSFISNY